MGDALGQLAQDRGTALSPDTVLAVTSSGGRYGAASDLPAAGVAADHDGSQEPSAGS